MSTLILTCDTGEGHNSCAKAIKEVYDAKGVPCEIVNPVRFVAEWFAKFVHWTHTTIYQKRPKVFEAGYRFTQKHNGLTTKRGSFPYWVLSFGAKKLHEYIIQNNFTDIICVHPLLMMMVSEQQRKYRLDIPVAFVATDYTCSPGVQDSKPDVCFIPEITLAEEFLCENIRFSQLEASGIPVRQQFYRTVDRKTAKWLSGVPANASHLLMMCGSMGCGPMEEMLDVLSAEESFYITLVCGNNEKLQQRLSEKYAERKHVHILGFVQNMSLLMDGADLFVTKPGGLSSTEAAVKCLPAVYINAVGGCENYNLDFFASRGCAVAADSANHAATLCKALLKDTEKLEQMRQALKKLQIPNAVKFIFETMTTRTEQRGKRNSEECTESTEESFPM